jgi:uncharacterized FlaG/YvyC family protein
MKQYDMATGSNTTAVKSSAEVLFSASAAAPSPTPTSPVIAQTQAPTEPSEVFSNEKNGADAVKVLLSTVASAEERKQTEKEEAKVGLENELAQKLRSSLNSDTAIKFNVDFHGKGKGAGYISSFNFQIVDRETGRVVRQFPPEEMVKIRQVDAGLFVDSSA